MSLKVLGIHHITAISGAAHQNYEFYTRALGLKLVKKTVNYDDPGTYHLYYGDATGSPGSLLTFFPYEGRPGRPGPGQVTATIYGVARGGVDEWESRLRAHGVPSQKSTRLGAPVLSFFDPHGMGLEILEVETATSASLGSFAGAALSLVHPEKTRELLEFLGYQVVARTEERTVLSVPGDHGFLELRKVSASEGTGGPGTVHHIALRLPDDAAQTQWREKLISRGYQVSPITDRNYFRSIYFRGPEGVLYELATDPPGMLVDEDEASLGRTLRLPPQYEKFRDALQDNLPPLEAAFRTLELPGTSPMLVGLHGTGGDETDLVPLLRRLNPEAHLLTLRGQVVENGQLRFFRRLREGLFDQRDLAERSAQFADFLATRAEEKVVVGYSNGANLAAHTMMFFPGSLQTAILIRPMLGWLPPESADLSRHKVLILLGERDRVVSPESGRELARALRNLGARVDVAELPAGHEVTDSDLGQAARWLAALRSDNLEMASEAAKVAS